MVFGIQIDWKIAITQLLLVIEGLPIWFQLIFVPVPFSGKSYVSLHVSCSRVFLFKDNIFRIVAILQLYK